MGAIKLCEFMSDKTSTRSTRRDFLRNAALASGAAAVVSTATAAGEPGQARAAALLVSRMC